ncbi:phenylalanine--tRNA ligase subunit alpha [Candidatus Bathyarchaeota archaeon]|nr:MAG: phenylalanine--tRNA ligase subunit alpha [Candidatus Bathyarchaeota archaeon]
MELRENDLKVLRTLREAGGIASVDDIVQKTGLADAAVARSSMTLSEQGLVKEQTTRTTEVFCTEEGHDYLANGLPERRVATVVHDAGGKLSVSEAVQQAGLPLDFDSIVTGWIARKGWGKIEKANSGALLLVPKNPSKDEDEEVLERIGKASIPIEESPSNLLGLDAIPAQASVDEVSGLTGEMILSGDWERVHLRSYNVSSPVPSLNPGKYHPYLRFLRMVKRKLVALGFREAVGPLVETAFINDDCLYMPQDHPAREIHDLYYLKHPSRASLEPWKDIVERVAQAHENGWRTGSTGWGYKYSREEASKLVLRSHGTALSVRSMMSKDLKIPGKYFAIARCFRPELLDRTHLTEFNQAEGIVLDPSLSLRNLLGVLEMFAREVAGADKVRFKPDYFPFTEPSVELQAYKEGYGWMEFGGSGIFRPEVTEPLGIKVPVIAWGLGIDRLYMMNQQIQDIRQLFTTDRRFPETKTGSTRSSPTSKATWNPSTKRTTASASK